MNVATRVLEAQRVQALRLAQPGIAYIQSARQGFWLSVLVVGLLLSAFSMIYAKDLERRLFIQYQEQQEQQARSVVEWNRLLLEQGTWSAQLRVQKIAAEELGMIAPASGDVIMIAEE